MAYSGFLLKIGEYEVEGKYLAAENYGAWVNTQTIDPYTDSDGILHVDFLPKAPLSVELTLPAMLTNKDLAEFMKKVKDQTVDGGVQRKFYCTAYIPELDDYVTELAYLADFKPKIIGTYGGVVHYDSIPLSIVGGIADD